MRTYHGEPFALEEHLGRLERSAGLIGIELPVPGSLIADRIRQTLASAGNTESYIRVILTRGEGEIDLDPAAARDPHLVVIVRPRRPLVAELVQQGASVLLVPSGRAGFGAVPDGSKTGNYLANIMALGRARQAGHHEAIMVEAGGLITEGASSNIFVVTQGRVRTPCLSTGILPGITRGLVIGLCRDLGMEVTETDLVPSDLLGAQEAFLTSTLREVLPVVRVGGDRIGDGRPGPVCSRIREAFLAMVAAGGPKNRDA